MIIGQKPVVAGTADVQLVSDPSVLEAIYRLRAAAWRARTDLFPGELTQWSDADDQGAMHWAVFGAHGSPIAAARLSTHPSIEQCPGSEVFAPWKDDLPGPVALLARLVVDVAYAGQGLSRQLDIVRIEAAQKLGCRSVVGSTYAGPKRLRALERLGFRVLGEAPPYKSGPLVGLAKNGGGAVCICLVSDAMTGREIGDTHSFARK